MSQGPSTALFRVISRPFASATPGPPAPPAHTQPPKSAGFAPSPSATHPFQKEHAQGLNTEQAGAHRAGAGGGGRAHRAEPGGGDSREPGARQALTFTLLTPSTAAAVAEARVLVCGWEAGRGARVLVGVALTQGPGGGRMGQRGQGVLIRGPTGTTVEVQGCEIWQEGRVAEGGVGRPSGDPLPRSPSLTAAQVPEDVVALLREGDLVHRVPQEATLQHAAGVLAGLAPFLEALHVRVQPVHHVRPWPAARVRARSLGALTLPTRSQPSGDPSPMTALAMVILSHMRSRISRPESGSFMTRTTAPMSLFTVSGASSSSARQSPPFSPEQLRAGGRAWGGPWALLLHPSQRPGST